MGDLRLINLEERGTMVEGWVQRPSSASPAGFAQQPSKTFDRLVKDFQPGLKLSLIVIQIDGTASCKYICLCNAVPGPEEEQPKEELTFLFSANVPPQLKDV